MRKFKRLVCISDLHCGSKGGLTPPKFNTFENTELKRIHTKLWGWYLGNIQRLKPIDYLIINGDLIDGQEKMDRSMGLMTTDRLEQLRMTEEVIRLTDPNDVRIVAGTGVHDGIREGFGSIIADKWGTNLKPVQRLDVNGKKFAFRHHIAGSGRTATKNSPALYRELANFMERVMDGQEKEMADVMVFSHVHLFQAVMYKDYLLVTTPGLQAFAEYADLKSYGTFDYGFTYFDVEEGGELSWEVIRCKMKELAPEWEKL